jgi:hypothetical protein
MDFLMSFLQTLPKIIAIAERLGKVFQDPDVLEWMNRLEASVDQLEKAGGKDEKQKAARDLVGVIGALK